MNTLQRERLSATLHHAYANVPHYRHAFDAAGVHPADFQQPDDLRRFSVHDKR
jgi:phenylacetate-CoA ligase